MIYISLWRRIASIIYDFVLIFAILMIMSIPFFSFNIEDSFTLKITMQIYYYLIIQYFFVWFWVNNDGTLGMKTWKIKISDNQGKKITYKKAIIRFNISILSISLFGFGFFLSIFHKEKKCLHDIISKTVLTKV
jgi:uncharacterized RDD family membrane protein YckC